MPTLIEYVKGVWTSLLPATVKSKMENIEDGLKDACDVLDLETDAGRSMAQAADAAAQRALLNVEDGADVTDEANVTAIVNATAEVTAAPAHWWVLVGGALKRMTQAGWTALVLVATGKTNGATGYTLAGGTTPKTLTVSADADTATIPNATGKSAAENIGGKAGASEAIKLGVAAAEAMETGTATATPNDTDVLPGVKADHSLLKYTWANIKAAIWTALGGLIAGGTAKATPLDADKFGYSSSADSNATRYVLWSSIKSVLATAFKHGGTDEIATATPGGNVIPKAGAGGTLAAGFIPQATESAVGGGELATSAEVAAGSSSTTLITPSALAAGFPHIKQLAAAEAETALWDYDTAAKMPPALLREIVEAASAGAATVKVDDLGYPSMMYVIRGPILAGHFHADMGSTTALKTAVIAAAGTGYTALDVLTIAGGTGGTVRVLTVGASGEVTSIEIANPGTGYSAATGAATSGGTGSACTITTTIGPIHNAFSVAGVSKTEILIGMFLSAQYGSGATARAVSWPGLYPTGSLDFDAAKALHTAKGSGWHMMTMWEQALVTWLSMKMQTEPRGNTYYGRAHDSGYEYECGVRSDGLAPGTASGTAKHRNGSGPDSWSHNAKRWGIHDLVGSMSEWRDGMKIVDGLIRMPLDNDFTLAEKNGETENWPSTGVYFDNTTAETGGAPRLSNARTNALIDPNYSSVAHKDMTLTAGFDGLDLVVRQRMLRANLAPKIASAGSNPFNPKGTVYLRNYGERLPHCGGYWNFTSDAGLGFLYLNYLRSRVDSLVGSRAAFISLS